MAITSSQAAKIVCELSDWEVTNSFLQKIIYLAHMVYLGRTNKDLVDEQFEAWDYGPVLPELYQKIKYFGNNPIQDIFYGISVEKEREEYQYLELACRHFLNKSPSYLVALTHRKDGAWWKNYKPNILNIKIPRGDIIKEYENING